MITAKLSQLSSLLIPSKARFLFGLGQDHMASGHASYMLQKFRSYHSTATQVILHGKSIQYINGPPKSKHARATSLQFGQSQLTIKRPYGLWPLTLWPSLYGHTQCAFMYMLGSL